LRPLRHFLPPGHWGLCIISLDKPMIRILAIVGDTADAHALN
jgi:hypothetical protein